MFVLITLGWMNPAASRTAGQGLNKTPEQRSASLIGDIDTGLTKARFGFRGQPCGSVYHAKVRSRGGRTAQKEIVHDGSGAESSKFALLSENFAAGRRIHHRQE